jgi:predicted phage terminase large subunit-like protein
LSKLSAGLVEGLVNGLLKKHFDEPADIPEVHREWWGMCCSDRKFVAIAAPRGHAKSTAITISYTIAAIVFRSASNVLVISDTESQACGFVDSIKRMFTDNEDLKQTFGIKGLAKDSVTEIIVSFDDGHEARLVAKGSGQSLRGALWDMKRPDLVVGDDLENEEIVMNKERREKFRKWMNGTVVPMLAKKGKLRIVGTILHADAYLERLMPKKHEKGVVENGLAIYSDPKKVWLTAKYKAHDAMLTKALWPENKGIEWLRRERETFREAGEMDLWAQEMLNIPLDEASAPFQRKDFVPMDSGDFNRNFHYYIGTDFALKEEQKSDYTAFVVGAVDEQGALYIVHVVKERMDVNESQDTLFELISKYNPEMVFFEKGQIWAALEVTIKERMYRTGAFFNYEAFPSMVEKVSRTGPVRARMRAGAVKFNKEAHWYQDFEDECVGFPRLAHDDQVDALALIGRGLLKFREAPSAKELMDEAYEEEKIAGGFYDHGREEMTGY